jgi:hypothetical protein
LNTQDVFLVQGAWEVLLLLNCRKLKSCCKSEDQALRGYDKDAAKAIEWQTLAACGLVHVIEAVSIPLTLNLAMIPPPSTSSTM